MAYDESVASRIRAAVADRGGISERKMFGGLCFMINGNMFAGVMGNELMLRVGPERFEQALAQPGARPMDFSKRPMVGMVYVAPPAFETESALSDWLGQALDFAGAMPGKQPGEKRR
jgi:TfoX/Sxy family transcriptional regulator of competence genes